MKRIRYEKLPDGSLASKWMVTPKSKVFVTIDTDGTYKIHHGQEIIQNKDVKSLQAAKKEVKKTLIELGVVFEPEIRPRYEGSFQEYKDEVLNELEKINENCY